MKKHAIALITLGLLYAQSSRAEIAVDAHAGTMGLGLGITAAITEQFNVRGIVNTFAYKFDDEASDIDYKFDLNLSSFGGILDWHPGGGGFRISAGVFLNNNKVDGTASPTSPTVAIGDSIFNTSDVGTLESDLKFNMVAPYFGIGWGNAIKKYRRWRISLDFGVLYQGKPEVDFRSIGANPLIQPLIDAEVAAEAVAIQDDLNQFELYPVASLGIGYRF